MYEPTHRCSPSIVRCAALRRRALVELTLGLRAPVLFAVVLNVAFRSQWKAISCCAGRIYILTDVLKEAGEPKHSLFGLRPALLAGLFFE